MFIAEGGMMTVVRPDPRRHPRSGVWQWLCYCTCGQHKWLTVAQLKGGRVKSCGCLRADPKFRKKARAKNRWRPSLRRGSDAYYARKTEKKLALKDEIETERAEAQQQRELADQGPVE